MALKAMLSLDLNNVTSEQRDKFYDVLKKSNLTKIETLTTVWKAVFQEGLTVERAIKTIKDIVSAAATAARVTRYDAAVMVGERDPEIF